MLREMAKGLVLAAVLSGLCPSTQANTTAALIAQTDLATPAAEPEPAPPKLRMALLLPLHSSTLGPAADALRAGFMAAYAHETEGVAINLVETDDSAQGLIAGYADAAAHNDIVIGPLSRSGVTLIARGDVVRKPTIALTQPDVAGDAELVLPPQMLIISLSIEDEARQIATAAWADQKMPKALVVSTNVAWQRRAAKAFAAQWQRLGQEPQSIELGVIGGYLSGNSLDQLRKRIQNDRPGLVFVALDAARGAPAAQRDRHRYRAVRHFATEPADALGLGRRRADSGTEWRAVARHPVATATGPPSSDDLPASGAECRTKKQRRPGAPVCARHRRLPRRARNRRSAQ